MEGSRKIMKYHHRSKRSFSVAPCSSIWVTLVAIIVVVAAITTDFGNGHRRPNGIIVVHGFLPSVLRTVPTKPIVSLRTQPLHPSELQQLLPTSPKTQSRKRFSFMSSSRIHYVLSSSRGDYGYDDDDDEYYDDEQSTSRRRRRRRTVTTTTKTQQQNDILDAADELEDDGFWDDDEDDDFYDDDDDEDDDDGIFGNVIIPNPLLDSMDPDGAADRFPELARDWRFWVDMVLFITVLDFLRELGTGGDIARYLQDMQEVLPPTFPQ